MLALLTAAAAASFAPALAAQAPPAQAYVPARTPDGYPNIEGVWRAWNLAKFDLEDHSAKPGVPAGRGFVVDPADGKIPYRPEMLERRQKNYEGTLTPDPLKNTDPLAKCYMPGVPRLTYLGWPFQIIQDKQDVNFTYEWSHKKRIAPIGDTSPLPDPEGGLNLRWNGMARGRYDGNSLVVTLGNFNAYTLVRHGGQLPQRRPHGRGALHPDRRPTPCRYEATMTDPKVFTRPWTIRMVLHRQKEVGLLDYECTAMLDDLGIHHTFPRDFDVQQ